MGPSVEKGEETRWSVEPPRHSSLVRVIPGFSGCKGGDVASKDSQLPASREGTAVALGPWTAGVGKTNGRENVDVAPVLGFGVHTCVHILK